MFSDWSSTLLIFDVFYLWRWKNETKAARYSSIHDKREKFRLWLIFWMKYFCAQASHRLALKQRIGEKRLLNAMVDKEWLSMKRPKRTTLFGLLSCWKTSLCYCSSSLLVYTEKKPNNNLLWVTKQLSWNPD